MLGSDVFMVKPFGLFRAIGKNALALVAQREVDGSRHFFAHGGVRFNLLTDRFDRCAGAEEAVRQRLILAEQAEQKMLGLDARTSELAGFVASEEDNAACL